MKYLLLLILFSTQLMALEVPKLTSPVEDKAQILNSSEKEEIINILHDLNDRDLIQMNVLTINSLDGENLEEYSIKVAEKWKLGSDKKDNGLILLLAMKERKIRIEVGNGIEGEVTDYLSSRIIERMKDYMRSGDFAGAIKVAIKNIQTAMEENLPENIAARAETDRLAAIEYQRLESERIAQEERQLLLDQKKAEANRQILMIAIPCVMLAFALILFLLSFNQNKIESATQLIQEEKKKEKDKREKLELTQKVHSGMKVDQVKYQYVQNKEEVNSLENQKFKLQSDIQSMKRYLGEG